MLEGTRLMFVYASIYHPFAHRPGHCDARHATAPSYNWHVILTPLESLARRGWHASDNVTRWTWMEIILRQTWAWLTRACKQILTGSDANVQCLSLFPSCRRWHQHKPPHRRTNTHSQIVNSKHEGEWEHNNKLADGLKGGSPSKQQKEHQQQKGIHHLRTQLN